MPGALCGLYCLTGGVCVPQAAAEPERYDYRNNHSSHSAQPGTVRSAERQEVQVGGSVLLEAENICAGGLIGVASAWARALGCAQCRYCRQQRVGVGVICCPCYSHGCLFTSLRKAHSLGA